MTRNFPLPDRFSHNRKSFQSTESNLLPYSREGFTLSPFFPGVFMRHLTSPLLICLVLSSWQVGAQTRRALLIGINTYQPAGTAATHPAGCMYGRCELGAFENLQGSVNDAQAMADLLTGPKFGFPAANVALLTNPAPPKPRPGVVILPAEQTSRDGILAAMQKYLVDVPQRGDTVVFYDASHGSLRVNSKGTKMAVWAGGKLVHADSTLVPSDAYKGGFDVRDREMTRIFNAALDKGIHLTVILDSCHSGGAARGIGPKYRERSLAYDPRDINEAPESGSDGKERTPPTERPDNPALVFSAAQQDQTAKEAPPPDTVQEPHGAFTAALIEALQVLPADAPASMVYQQVKAVLEGNGVSDQEPDLDANTQRRQQSLFGGKAASSDKVLTAAIKTDDDGAVWLDIGRVSGVGPGSEFTSVNEGSGTSQVKLRVTDLQGIARSSAQVVSPAGARVLPGEIFALNKLVPPQSAPLLFWLWPATLSRNEIAAAVAEVKASGVVSVSDPAEENWTHVLSWDGTDWTLQQAKPASDPKAGSETKNLDKTAPPPVKLGSKLTADGLKQHVGKDARLWVNLPLPHELADKLTLHDPQSAVQAAKDLSGANYLLTGVLTEDGLAYAWFHKSEFAAGPRANNSNDHSPGCSTDSPYPVRTDWIALGNDAQSDALSKKLNDYAQRLGKVHGWLTLQDSANGESAETYFKLTLVHAADGSPLSQDQPARPGDKIQMMLQSADRVVDPRWVYVLDISCNGKGSLLYPINFAENQFPNAAANDRKFVLPHSLTLKVGPPYGVDTLIMLSTAQPLPDPSSLTFEGVATRGGRGVDSPLQRLLSNASSSTRGLSEPVPTDWGITVTSLHSVPGNAVKQAQ
jgi:Caspase domain